MDVSKMTAEELVQLRDRIEDEIQRKIEEPLENLPSEVAEELVDLYRTLERYKDYKLETVLPVMVQFYWGFGDFEPVIRVTLDPKWAESHGDDEVMRVKAEYNLYKKAVDRFRELRSRHQLFFRDDNALWCWLDREVK